METSFNSEDQFVGQVTADVSSVPLGSEFTLIVQATYWNAFSGVDGDDFSTYTHDQTDQPEAISMVVIFPSGKPFRSMTTLEQSPGQSDLHAFQSQGLSGPGNLSYYWSTTNKNPGRWFYKFQWTW